MSVLAGEMGLGCVAGSLRVGIRRRLTWDLRVISGRFLNWRPYLGRNLSKENRNCNRKCLFVVGRMRSGGVAAVKENGKDARETYLEFAKSYLSRRDYRNAKSRRP